MGHDWKFDRPVRPADTRFKEITADDLKKEPDNGSRLRHKVAMFLTGFIMLTPHRIAILCAPYIVKRFHLPPDKIPLFIYKFFSSMELASLIGTTIQVVLTVTIASITATACKKTDGVDKDGSDTTHGSDPVLFGKKVYKDTTTPAMSDKHKDVAATQCKGLFSIIFAWIMFSSSILTYIFFVTGDDYGHFNLFFWSVIFNAFANGMYSSISFGINTNTAIYAVGLPLSGAFTFIFNKICRSIHNRWDWDDYDYTRVQLQIIFTILILFITAAIWTADQVIQIIGYDDPTQSGIQPQDDNYNLAPANVPGSSSFDELFKTGGEQGLRHWSPILMLGSSLGSVYAFYPAITPYMLMDIDEANDLDQWIQFISSIPTLVIGFLDEFDVGPGGVTAGTWGEFIANDKTNYKEFVLSKLNEVEGKVQDAIDGLGSDQTENINKLNEVKTKIGDARGKVTAITTGEHFKDIENTAGKGGAAKDALTQVNSTAESEIGSETINYGTGKTIQASDITTPITEAKDKFTSAATNKVGDYAIPDTAAPQAGNWNIGGGGRWHWHPIGWCPFVPYILCLHIFIIMLHFPSGYVATFLHSKQWLLKCICISFNFWQEIMEIIGFAGAGKQSNKSGWAMVYNGFVGTFNNFFFFFVMIICMFTGD